jgi:hypothetical protein
LVGPPTERGDPASLSNQPAAYLVDLRGSCIDFARQIFDACRHVGTQLAKRVSGRMQAVRLTECRPPAINEPICVPALILLRSPRYVGQRAERREHWKSPRLVSSQYNRLRCNQAAPGLDQHVQAHQKSGQMDSTGVIDQKFTDDQRTSFVERGIVDDFEHIYPSNPILYVTEVHERLAREPLTALRAKFEWSELNIFDVAGPTGRHGVLLGTKRWHAART